MKVLLTKDVAGIGRVGDIKEVSDGHARNFLLPKGLALPASQTLVNKVTKETREKLEKKEREQSKLEALSAKLHKISLVIKGKAGKDHLFAAIHEKEIAQAIRAKFGIELDESLIIIPAPIKALGQTQVTIKVSPNLSATINLDIQPQ